MTINELEKLNEKLSNEFWIQEKINNYLKGLLEKINKPKYLSPGVSIIEMDYSSYIPSLTTRVI